MTQLHYHCVLIIYYQYTMNMINNNNILSLIENTPDSLMQKIAERVRLRRLELNWTQKLLASKAGIPLATYRRFELKGELSLRGLVMIAISLGAENNLEQLFSIKNYQNMDDLINATQKGQHKRATKNE